ncbi:MAG: RNA polymerase sigma factor [Planctomycetota bacterium]|jgi:RNA polymerase sigma factor (sigma-70 family)|nr:RNA polymerase sigma factor [Planctomycetota bacterium]
MSEADASLVQRVLDGDRSAFEALMATHMDRVRAVAGSVVSDPEGVDDVVQEAFIRAYRRIGQLADYRTFPAWLARIARNEAISWHRRRKRRAAVPLDSIPLLPDTSHDHDDDNGVDEERLAKFNLALGKLRPAYREILALKYEAQLSYEEIAETLGTSMANVEKKLYRARQRLQKLME